MNEPKNLTLICECECGRTWDMDYSSAPEECAGAVWRLWADGEPGAWVTWEGVPSVPIGHD